MKQAWKLLWIVALAPSSACSTDPPSIGNDSLYAAPDWYQAASRQQSPDSWTMVVLPDTQDYTSSRRGILTAQIDWILENRHDLDIRLVAHLGDIVPFDRAEHWDVAHAELGRLAGRVPLALPPGNHDLWGVAQRRSSMIDAYFEPSDLVADGVEVGLFDPNSIWNTYHVLDGNGGPWLVLALEFGPRDEVLKWAGDMIARHRGHAVIVVTHAFLRPNNERYDWRIGGLDQGGNPHAYGLANVNDGEEIWRKLVSPGTDVRLVLSGHALGNGVARRRSRGGRGQTVHQLLSNYQRGVVHRGQSRGRSGYLRLMHFESNDAKVDVATYSPWRRTWLNDEDNRFEIKLDPVLANHWRDN
ncbi:MAG: metallophosphoesterase [Nannocystaceae bacterium]